MTNHIHMLAQVSATPLGQMILRVASRYARLFQAQIETTGHLFERRYHAVLIDAERYLLTVIRYIHLNPVRAGLVSNPANYPWSSHRDYLGESRTPWVTTSHALGLLSSDNRESHQAYVHWVGAYDGARWGEGDLSPNPGNPQVLGDDNFVATVSTLPASQRHGITLDQLLCECSRAFDLTVDAIVSSVKSRRLSVARAWLAHEASARGIANTSAIARCLGRDESAIRRLMLRRRRPAHELTRMSEMSDPAP
jgi:hypothetical protein